MITFLNWLLRPTGLVLLNGRVIDELICTARRFDLERMRQLTRENKELKELVARVGRQPASRRRPTASEYWG